MKNKPKEARPSLCSECLYDGLSCLDSERKRDRYYFCKRFCRMISDEAFSRLIARIAARDRIRKETETMPDSETAI